LAARPPDANEERRIRASLDVLPDDDGTRPRHIFVVDERDLNACVSGTALYVNTGLLRSKYLSAVLAHELGHLRGGDGQLGLALRALVVPGAFWLSGALHGLVVLVRNALVWLIARLVRLLGLYGLVGMIRLLISVFLVYLPHYGIIFAMGGVGPRLLDFAWERYFIGREFQADAYAAQRGQRLELAELFGKIQVALVDITIPWSSRRTHPPLRQRIERLLGDVRQSERYIDNWLSGFGEDTPARFRRPEERAPAAAPRSPAQRPHWALALGACVLLALLAYGAFVAFNARPRLLPRPPIATPTVGPTPTLGFEA
ncbi:MAG: M48 family metalloprotease, partial [Chloroflexales bacterium]|nr:M48 family metalloprotease [Chloroflexales bacterium]